MDLNRTVARSVTATTGTFLIALGVQQFLRVTGSYYCCRLYIHGPVAVGWALVGWALVLLALDSVLNDRPIQLPTELDEMA